MGKKNYINNYEPNNKGDVTQFIISDTPLFIRFHVEIIAKENNLEKIAIVRNIVKTLPGSKLCFEKRGTVKSSFDGKITSYYHLYVPAKFITNRDFDIFLNLGLFVDTVHTTISRKERRKLKYKRIHL